VLPTPLHAHIGNQNLITRRHCSRTNRNPIPFCSWTEKQVD